MTDIFDDPGSSTGIDLNELNGRLLLIKPTHVETGINTAVGVKDATVADVHVLDGPNAGHAHHQVFVWPKVLQSQVKTNIGTDRYNLGRLTQGTPKPGQKPPWKLDAATDADKDLARRYLGSDTFKNNGKPAPAPAAAVGGFDDQPPF